MVSGSKNRKMKSIYLTFFFMLLSCCNGSRNASTTPKKYQYEIDKMAEVNYQKDTSSIRAVLRKMINEQIKPFDRETYNKGTDSFIDTLVYSPDLSSMIVFIIVKNSTMKLLQRENDSKFYYDAFYLFCSRDSANDALNVYDYTGYRLNFFYNYSEIRETLRDYCFTRMMRIEGSEQYYNINDIRFWNSKYFERVLRNSRPISL